MCRKYPLVIKDQAKKIRKERFFVDAQLACDKAGGLVKKSAMKNMSLDHFFSICALNNIRISFEYKKD